MPTMSVILDGDGCWPDLKDKQFINLESPIEVAGLPAGMTSGKPSVSFRFTLPDGTVVIAQTSMALFQTAAKMLEARYPST